MADLDVTAMEARRMVGLRRHFSWDRVSEVPGVWEAFAPFLDAFGPQDAVWGLSLPPSEGDPAEGFDYMAAVDSDGPVPAGLDEAVLPHGDWARFVHEGPVAGLPASCRRAFEAVAAAEGWDHAPAAVQIVERYGDGFDARNGEGRVDLWVPVTRA